MFEKPIYCVDKDTKHVDEEGCLSECTRLGELNDKETYFLHLNVVSHPSRSIECWFHCSTPSVRGYIYYPVSYSSATG